MKRLIIFFLVLVLAVWVGIQIYDNPGYVLFVYKKWAIETTTWFLVLALLLTFFLLHLIFNLVRGTVHLPTRIGDWWRERQQRKAIKNLNKGFCDLVLGKWKTAEKKFLKSAKDKDLSFINYAIAAQAADAQQALEKRNKYLLLAKKNTVKQKNIVDIMQVQFLLKNNQPEDALSLLIPLREQKPKDRQLLKLLSETYQKLHDWYHLQTILKDIKKYDIYDEAQYLVLEKKTYLHALNDHYFVEFSEVQMLWNKMPKYLRHDSDVLLAYANHLKRWNRGNEAEELIRKELKKKFNNQLMDFYITTQSKTPAKQLALGEKFLKESGDNAQTLRAMGFLCLQNRLWGQARDYLEGSLKLSPEAETFTAIGYVYEKLGEKERALNYYRKGLNLMLPFDQK